MKNKKEKILVGVHDNSTDWGIIGTATTVAGALRIGRKWAREFSSQKGWAGYGPKIVLLYQDGYKEIFRAW